MHSNILHLQYMSFRQKVCENNFLSVPKMFSLQLIVIVVWIVPTRTSSPTDRRQL